MEEEREVSREEILELLKGVRSTTKKGGYEEVPKELILEQAEKVGLSEEEIPKVRVEDTRGGYIDKTPEGELVIIVPRREPKWKVPSTLRHELSHVRYGHLDKLQAERTWEEDIKIELEVMKIQEGGRLSSDNLTSLVLTLVLEEGLPRGEATTWVMEEARDLGVSEHSITSSKRWLRSHWKRLKELEGYL